MAPGGSRFLSAKPENLCEGSEKKRSPERGARGLVVRELTVGIAEHLISPLQSWRCGVTPLIVTNPLKYADFQSDYVTH